MDLKTQVDDKPEEKKTPGVQKIRTKKCEQKQCVQKKSSASVKMDKTKQKKKHSEPESGRRKNMEEEQIFCQVYIH